MVISRRPTMELIRGTHQELNQNKFGLFYRKGTKISCGPTIYLVKGLVLTIIGIIFTIWTPFKLLMDERMRMHPGLPAYECWETPPDKIVFRVRIFNVTNSEEFLAGIDKKLNMVEIGPIIYKEHLTHTNITFNDNSTISYTARHTAEYVPEMNHLNHNDTIIVPNYALLVMASFLHDFPFFTKLGFNMLVRQHKTQPFLKMTIYNFLWNFTDPIIEIGHKYLPTLVPVKNMGMLSRIYDDFEDEVTMFIGTKHSHEQFSLIDKFGGSEYLPKYKNCADKVTNATEGVTYAQLITKESILKYWRKTICKVVGLTYQKDLVHSGVNAYKFVVPNSSFDRTYPESDDCYKGYPSLPNGLSDVSNCYFDGPIAASFPHNLYGEGNDFITGMEPDVEKHESFVVVEPTSGIPLESVARSQSNIVVRKLSGFSQDILKFSNTVIPMFWVEYHQNGLPWNIHLMVYMISMIISPLQIVSTSCIFLCGFLYVFKFGKVVANANNLRKMRRLSVVSTIENESEVFLKQ